MQTDVAPSRMITEVPDRALAVYAHPDDPDISCGGSIALWALGGCEVSVVICAAGDKGSTDPSDQPEELALRRTEEARRANDLLGVAHLHMLGHKDGELENNVVLRAELVGLIRAARPDVVLCPDPTAVFFGKHHYNHRDHRTVGWATLDSVSPAAGSPLYFPDAGPAHVVGDLFLSGSLEPDCFVDITETIDTKIAAVSCHQSQLPDGNDWFSPAVREGAEGNGREVGVAFAEAFRGLHLSDRDERY